MLIPSFQHERYIVDAITSVLTQTYPGFRVLVVDDASTDRTVERATSIDDRRVTVLVNPQNVGLGQSVVGALAQVTTPFVALLNSDDLFHPERLRLTREVLLGAPEVQVVATGVTLADRHGRALHAGSASRFRDGLRTFYWVRWYERTMSAATPNEAPFLRLLRNNFLLTSSNILCRTDFLRDHGAALCMLQYCLDWKVFLSAAGHGQLAVLTTPLLAYRLHPTNTVWFTPRTRPAYTNEVAAVAADALASYLLGVQDATAPGAVKLAGRAIGANPEIDRALFEHELMRQIPTSPNLREAAALLLAQFAHGHSLSPDTP